MREQLFVDAWGWLKILSRRESRDAEVAEYVQTFLARGGAVFTTDCVLEETLTLLFKRLLFEPAFEEYKTINAAEDDGFLEVE